MKKLMVEDIYVRLQNAKILSISSGESVVSVEYEWGKDNDNHFWGTWCVKVPQFSVHSGTDQGVMMERDIYLKVNKMLLDLGEYKYLRILLEDENENAFCTEQTN